MAINALEDIGYFCVDNIPPELIFSFVQVYVGKFTKIAFVVDVRGGEMFLELKNVIKRMRKEKLALKVLYLESPIEVVKRRYKETRRPHPLYHAAHEDIDVAVALERELLEPIRLMADFVIDTGLLNSSALRESVVELFLSKVSDAMLVKCTSFGFKFGTPGDADLMFDVRCLPNPFYVPELKNLTGASAEIQDFVMSKQVARELEDRLRSLFDFLLPKYVAEGKSGLVIAFGCTGGKHRSVTFAIRTSLYLQQNGFSVTSFHRDIAR